MKANNFKFFLYHKKISYTVLIILAILISIVVFVYYSIPTNKVDITSELVMLGDMNDDNKWNEEDESFLSEFVLKPFYFSKVDSLKVDVNKNGYIDDEDIGFLTALYKNSDPYVASANYNGRSGHYPKAREFFRYVPQTEYIQRPLYLLENKISEGSPFKKLLSNILVDNNLYDDQLLAEIYNEAIRFSFIYDKRKGNLNEIEKRYIEEKIDYCNKLFENKDYYNLLLNLIGIVEDGETLSTKNQSKFIFQTLYFRNHLRDLLNSELYSDFLANKKSYESIFVEIEKYIQEDFEMTIKINNLESPRDLSNISNYLERAEWQYNKSVTNENDFRRLVLFAQYDRRYLRAVSNTTVKNDDLELQNHNLPMILLFRESLNIKDGDKKAAIGMLDEAVRIPFAWIKSLPKNQLPSSLAFENFLLPGNKEDGSDKSRHWNVFGGISLYKTPEESFVLSLAREASDLKNENYSHDAMREFIRDTISNLNGIYYVASIEYNNTYTSN